jgi:undecaprenyl pyrophosphate synthase
MLLFYILENYMLNVFQDNNRSFLNEADELKAMIAKDKLALAKIQERMETNIARLLVVECKIQEDSFMLTQQQKEEVDDKKKKTSRNCYEEKEEKETTDQNGRVEVGVKVAALTAHPNNNITQEKDTTSIDDPNVNE